MARCQSVLYTYVIISLLVLAVGLINFAVSVDVQTPYVRTKKLGYRLSEQAFSVKVVGTVLSCGLLCGDTPSCESFNFARNSGICELNRISSTALDVAADYVYMEIGKDYALANDIGSCVNNECYNGATCTVISPCSDRSETEPYQYVCQCPDGYRGLLCEETTKYINVAIGKPVSQISTAYGGLPELAVDGDNHPDFTLNGVVKCTHTKRVLNAWWKVDLEKGYLIKWINITNRGDMPASVYSWRILSSEVRVGFSETFANNGVCGQITEIFPEETDQILLDCDHMFGRFVSVERTDATDEPLALCEVEVYAQDPEEWRVVFVGLSRSTDDLYQLWLDGTAVGDESNAFSNSTSNYVNDVIGIWDALDVKYVKLSLFKDDVEVATIVFDGVGSTKTNWFSPSRLLGSSWTDLTNETDSMMSGTDAGQGDLGFSVSVATGLIICNSWNGWILVMQTSCGWAPTNSEWVVMYSTSVNQNNWNSGGTDEADLMMIQILS